MTRAESRASGLVREYLSYQPDTGKVIWKKRLARCIHEGLEAGTNVGDGYRRIQMRGLHLRTHRVVWFLNYGTWPKDQIDHINGDRQDNRIENLREASLRENQQNQLCHRNGKLLGANYNKKGKVWMSEIRTDGVRRYLGQFPTKEEAHLAYMEAVNEALVSS